MAERIRTEEDIAAQWCATLEQQYLSEKPNNSDEPYEQNMTAGPLHWHHPLDLGDSPDMASLNLSQNGTNYSMPTRNLSDLGETNGAPSIGTARGSMAKQSENHVESTLIDLAQAIPNEVRFEEQSRYRIEEELQRAAQNRSLSDKLTDDGSMSEPELPTRPIRFPGPSNPAPLGRPAALNRADRCITPQRSNVQRASRFPTSPGGRTNTSEIFHHTYEADPRVPPRPVPPFVVVPNNGVARVTIRPTTSELQGVSDMKLESRSNNRRFYKRMCLFGLMAILILALVTLAAGIIKANEHSDAGRSFPTPPETDAPSVVYKVPTPVPSVRTPHPTPIPSLAPSIYSNPTPRPFFSIPNEDGDVDFPDLGGGVVGREETESPTTVEKAPTRPPRTKRPTSTPSASPSPSDLDGFNTSLGSSAPSQHPSFAPSISATDEVITRNYVRALIYSVSSASGTMIDDISTPQYRAFEWLVADQMATDTLLPEDRIIQRFALATFYYATSGKYWETSTLWLTLNNECDWYTTRNHDVCDSMGLLHSLELEGNGLAGSLPPELGLISFRRIFLRNNNIGGAIPTEIGSLSKLEFFQVTSNVLTATIPTEIGSLARLVVLGVGRNRLEGTLPTELGMLRRLDTFGMEDNVIEGGIPSELGKANKLRFLSMCANALSGEVPSEIGLLLGLSVLKVAGNGFWGSMPSEVCSLRDVSLSELTADCEDITCEGGCCTTCRMERDPRRCP